MSSEESLPRRMAMAYALPSAGLMWTQILFTNYFFKYSVDVLLIAPATIGTILLVTRLWDAVSDPAVGYLTDGTRSSAGRRRPWLLGSALPVALASLAMWSPPGSLSGTELMLWMFVAVALWETAMTTFFVPYMALGAEITMAHHDRTRIAGYRHILGGLGQFSVIGSVYLLTHAESPRDVAFWVVLVGGGVATSLMMGGVWFVRERASHRTRGARKPTGAFRDVIGNRHLRRLVTIYFFEISAVAAIGLLASFVCEYVVGNEGLFPLLLLVFQIASYVSTPLVVRLSRGLGKKRVWMACMSLQACGFAATAAAGAGDEFYLLACMALVGLGATGSMVLGMSIMADVVDYDELRSGERKEALHYAAINIARKVSFASVSALVGLAMESIGFEPNAHQTPETVAGLSALFAGIPAVALVVGIVLLVPFGLTESEHAKVRAELDARHAD
ncbi:MFS transporter [Myxococcota bacterium]|nr:MFS transporter [Myxococcota bacterium]